MATNNRNEALSLAAKLFFKAGVSSDDFLAACSEAFAGARSALEVNFDDIAVGIAEFLLRNPGMRSCPMDRLVQRLYEKRLSTDLADANDDERDAARERLKEVIPHFVKENSDWMYIGRKTGIAFRKVEGEYNAKGEQVLRWSDEDWTKLTTPKKKGEDSAPDSVNAAAQ